MAYLQLLTKALGSLMDARFVALAAPSFAYLYTDAAIANTIVYSFAVMIALAAVSHIVRKVYFPYVDLEANAKASLDSPLAAAIVFLAVSMVLCTIIFATTMWLKG